MKEKEKELIMSVTALFMQFGIKSLTMDDICRHLGISKKTLYQYVSDKKDLVKKSIELAIEEDQCLLGAITIQEENAIDELLAINIKISEKLQSVQPAVMYDLQKYYPEAWKIMENHKQCFVNEMVIKNINTGIEQGLYRDNVNPEIVAKIYVSMIDKIFDVSFFPAHKYSFQEMHKEIARYHIRGIANDTGITYLVNRLKDENHDF
jgi:AcrR family transcriptional regulator